VSASRRITLDALPTLTGTVSALWSIAKAMVTKGAQNHRPRVLRMSARYRITIAAGDAEAETARRDEILTAHHFFKTRLRAGLHHVVRDNPGRL
jgi:hypothetical protein